MVPTNPSPNEGNDGAENRGPSGENDRLQRRSEAGFRWECPICGMARVNAMSRQGETALRALKRHVHGTDGDGHGSKDSYPDDVLPSQLHRYVHPVDDV